MSSHANKMFGDLPAGAYIPAGMNRPLPVVRPAPPPPVVRPVPAPPPVREVVPLGFGYFSSHGAPQPLKMWTAHDLLSMAKTPRIGTKATAPAIAQHNGQGKTGAVAASALFAYIAIDHDNDNKSRAEIQQLYTGFGVSFIAYTTSGHLSPVGKSGESIAPVERWKVIIPLACAVDAETHATIARGAAHALKTDNSQARKAQIAYVPNKLTSEAPYDYIDSLGSPSEWMKPHGNCAFMTLALKGWDDLEAKRIADETAASAKPRQPANDQHGIIEKICDYYSQDMGAVLESYGYIAAGRDAYLSPNSSSGTAGVRVLERDGKPVVYSHHSADGDPLSADNHGGHALDIADVICTLNYKNDVSAMIAHYAPLVDGDGQQQRQREYGQEQARLKLVEASNPSSWVEPVDLFTNTPVPPFPMECVPSVVSNYAEAISKASGFDAGAYAFCALIVAAGHIKHSHRVRINDSYSQGGVLWGGLCDPSGGGKSAIMSAMIAPLMAIDKQLAKRGMSKLSEWQGELELAKKNGEQVPPRPVWQQRIISDTTTEAAGALLEGNDGLLLHADEITEFIGRMDAYSGGSGKDRGVWLKSYDGESVTINRAGRLPVHIPRFSVGIIAGMQPETLARLFNKSGGGAGSDGLFQRFNLYQVTQAGNADFTAEVGSAFTQSYIQLFSTLEGWNGSGFGGGDTVLDRDAVAAHQDYVNSVRKITARTSSPRFKEHLSKFQAFVIRLALVLHCIECAERGQYGELLTLETYNRAKRIMEVLYRHSEAAYLVLDNTLPETHGLIKSAAEAILSKKLAIVHMGDLSRHATGWRAADTRLKQAAIDGLIELDWLRDVTPEQGGRGRPSQGQFAVNPKAFELFFSQSERIVRERAERYEAIQAIAPNR